MSKTKTELPDYIDTEHGRVQCARYEYRGKQYMQKEATVRQTLDVTSLLSDAGVMGAADQGDVFDLNVATIVRVLSRGDFLDQLLTLLVTYPDGSKVGPNELTAGTINQFLPFAERVINDFFTLNGELGRAITKYVGGLMAFRMAGNQHLQSLIASAISQMGSPQKSRS